MGMCGRVLLCNCIHVKSTSKTVRLWVFAMQFLWCVAAKVLLFHCKAVVNMLKRLLWCCGWLLGCCYAADTVFWVFARVLLWQLLTCYGVLGGFLGGAKNIEKYVEKYSNTSSF